MSETSGRCRREIDSIDGCAVRHIPGGVRPRHVLADAIDRLAADVEAIKAKADRISPDDVRHFVESEKAWVKLVEEQRDAAIRERDEARAEIERLRGELAARPAVNSPKILDSSPAAPQPAAPADGWLTERERHVLSSLLSERPVDSSLHWADDVQPVFRSILSRAGSPPVVEVPMFENYAPEVLHLRYRDAMDRAGVAWKEVPRE